MLLLFALCCVPQSSDSCVQASGEAVTGEEMTSVLLSLVAAGKVEPVQCALEHGADVNVAAPFTPLYAAVKIGHLEVIKVS